MTIEEQIQAERFCFEQPAFGPVTNVQAGQRFVLLAEQGSTTHLAIRPEDSGADPRAVVKLRRDLIVSYQSLPAGPKGDFDGVVVLSCPCALVGDYIVPLG
jgi:hypothetical protein